ncbi:MAG TPA: VanZ family protein [Bacteroidales bacterium]|nr:VanZ family protein [Bacteroidales bacterium]HQJ21496.1 VanZ family protein [Bacteroidales bacterium]
MNLRLRLYRFVFWAGYVAVLIVAFIPVAGELNRIKIGPGAFKIRLDFLLHFAAYFLICMYYLAGMKSGLSLFSSNPLKKFVLLLLFLAVITEVVQLWVPQRAFNVFDMVANLTGVAVGAGVVAGRRRQAVGRGRVVRDEI